jgi:hypothetical protein
MKLRNVFGYALALLIAGSIAGCALFQSTPADPTQAQMQQQQAVQQVKTVADSLAAVQQILVDLKSAKATPAAPPATNPSSTSVTTAPSSPAAPNVDAQKIDKVTQALSLLTPAVQDLQTQLQNAPNVDAQKQAAFAEGVKTAQAAAVTFGGQYGGLIAAGLGILSILVQGIANSKNAHATAQAAQQTAQQAQVLAGQMATTAHQTAIAAVGAFAGTARNVNDAPGNCVAAAPAK